MTLESFVPTLLDLPILPYLRPNPVGYNIFVARLADRKASPSLACHNYLRDRLLEGVTMVPPTYQDRDTLLVKLGYASYDVYLASEHWKRIRSKAFRLHGRKCRICKRGADVIHHLAYDESTLLGHDFTRLVPFCNGCHKQVEFRRDRTKRSLKESEVWYRRFLISDVPKTAKELKKAARKSHVPSKRCETCNCLLRRTGGPCRTCAKQSRIVKSQFANEVEKRLASERVRLAVVLPQGPKILKSGWTIRRLKQARIL